MIHFLKHSQEYPKFFWKSKKTGKMSASFGKKETLTSSQNYVGSFDLKTSHLWSAKEEISEDQLGSLQPIHYNLVKQKDSPCFDRWEKLVHLGKSLNKVVLARKRSLIFDKQICPFYLLERIEKKSSSHFLFLYQPNETTTFLGASPETLFYRKDNTLFTQALAGTKKRGENAQEDEQIGKMFVKDTKEVQEFSYVSDDLERKIKQICLSYKKSPLHIFKTPWIQHLQRTFQGILKDPISDLHLIKHFHPTPAVGGVPQNLALSFLKIHEPFDRNHYAAPIGKISEDESEFAVAIRSCLIYKNTLSIYSGTGIVQDSDPKKEWEELNHKMRWILDVLDCHIK